MAESTSPVSGVAERYASALFELAVSEKQLVAVEKDLGRFDELMKGSADLERLVRFPVFSTEEQTGAISAVLDKAGIKGFVGNFIRVVAGNRRLFVMRDIVRAFRQMAAAHRGEISADVKVANPLTAEQSKQLQSTLKGVVGKDVALDVEVDPSILGGLIVKVGSRQIDTSLRTKLSSLKLALKEVG